MSPATIFCILAGRSTPFHVDIEMDKTVSHLKASIRTMKPNELGTFDPEMFTLYRIDEGTETLLNPLHKLHNVFGPFGPPDAVTTAHILVHLPESESINSALGHIFVAGVVPVQQLVDVSPPSPIFT